MAEYGPSVTTDEDCDLLRLPETWIESFAEDVGYLWCPPKIDILDEPPLALDFYRDYVATSRPCIIRNAILDPLTSSDTSTKDGQQQQKQPLLLTLDDIMERLDPDETLLTVDVTPDGHGDCVRQVTCGQSPSTDSSLMFVQPKEVRMSLREFHRRLRRQQEHQRQQGEQMTPSFEKESSTHLDITIQQSCDVNDLPSVPLLESNMAIRTTDQDKVSTVLTIPDESIVYYSRQNDCLRTPEQYGDEDGDNTNSKSNITDLATLFPSSFAWASFGTPLEAMNLWMGNACSVSSMHKDHYENLFYVASGEKVFTICPPADAPFLYPQMEYASGQFECTTTTGVASKTMTDSDNHDRSQTSSLEWRVKPLTSTTTDTGAGSGGGAKETFNMVRWIHPDITPLLSNDKQQQQHRSLLLLRRFPLLRHVHPMEIKVQAGEMLYLPSLWFHRVTQTCETIGINYWYDMRFDGNPLWCYFNLLQEMTLTTRPSRGSNQRQDQR